jgi:serine/threonine protein kinase
MEQLEELLLRWEELAEAGQPVTAHELCRDCPELVEELQKRIDALREMDWLQSKTSFDLVPGAEPVPGYRLVQRIGKGGFGEVWKAVDAAGCPVALKFVPKSGGEASVECRALDAIKNVRHPHLLAVFGSYETDEFLVIAMELADRTLLDRVRDDIPPEELLNYFRQAAEGLDFLHEQGVQHRDVKPQNLLLIGDKLKVADFGLARVLSHSVTGHTGSLSLGYAAPEFFEGVTTRQSDQYSLAVAYCHLRGGRLPFEGTAAQMVAGHLHRSPDLSMLSESERPAVERALSKSPKQRWPTCQDFIDAVERGSPRRRSRRAWLAAAGVAVGLGVLPFLRLRRTPPPELVFVRRFNHSKLPSNIRCAVAGSIGETVAFSNGTDGPTLWDVDYGTILRQFEVVGGPGAALAPFSVPHALSGSDDGRIILWDLRSGEEIREFKGHEQSISSVAFSPDGKQLLSGACDRTVRLWDRLTGEELRCCRGHQSIVSSVAFGSMGRRALSASWDGTVRLWDLDTGRQLKQFEGHTGRVRCVAFSLDGRFAASGADDCTVRLWDLEGGKEIRRFEGHQDVVFGVAFWQFGRILSVGGRTVRIWDQDSGRELCRSTEMPSTGQSLCWFDLAGRQHLLVGTELDGLFLWRLPQEG